MAGARRSALAAAGLTVLLAAGCGGGRLSHGDFVEKADAVCTAYRSEAPPLLSPKSYDAVVAWGRKTLPLYAAALQKLRALQPPQADDETVRTWLAADARVQAATRELVEAAQKRDYPSLSAAASRAQLAGSQSRQAATSLGLEVCGAFAASGR
jgi:hypothetical protein